MLKVTLIRPEGCAHCVQVKVSLEQLKKEFPQLQVEDINMETPAGLELVRKHGIMASPGILVNGQFFASGGATIEQLRKKFQELTK